MASGTSQYWADALLNLILGATSFSAPATIYVAVYTTTPGPTGGGTEATGGGYAREGLTNNTTNWPNATGTGPMVKSNGVAYTWSAASGSWSSGSNMVGAALLDASTSGDLLYYGDLTVAKPVNTGDTASFAIGAISISQS